MAQQWKRMRKEFSFNFTIQAKSQAFLHKIKAEHLSDLEVMDWKDESLQVEFVGVHVRRDDYVGK